MANFELEYDEGRNLIFWRNKGFVGESEGTKIADQFCAMIDDVRRRGHSVRLVLDNGVGAVFAQSTQMAITARVGAALRPEDRRAIVTSSALSRLQIARNKDIGTPLFATEREAIDWMLREAA